ncbi:MAG: hypothetical protein AB7G23_00805 [Vicinamibacterales bacterium]
MTASRLTRSALAALCVTLAMVCTVAVSGGRDGLVRRARGGAQRLDSADGLAHEHETPDVAIEATTAPVYVTGGLDAPPGPALVSAALPAAAPPDQVLAPRIALVSAVVLRPRRPFSGRAPPLS